MSLGHPMTCTRVDEVLCESPAAAALAHAKGCADCGPARAAWDAMNGPAASSASLDKAREAARAEFRAQPKARAWWVDAWVVLAVNVAVAALGSLLLSVPPVHADSPLSRWGIGAALMALMALGAWAAIRPRAKVLRVSMLALASLAAVWVGFGGSGLSGDRPFASGLACAATECVVTVVPLLVALWITSRFAFDFGRAIVGGLSVGATGMLVLHIHCANGASSHLFTFHVLPWLALAIAAVVIRRMLPSRSYAA